MHEERLSAEKVRLINTGTISALISNTVLAGATAAYFWDNSSVLYNGPWTISFLLLLLFRFYLYRAAINDRPRFSNHVWLRLYIVAIWMVGLLWGSAVFVFGDTNDIGGTFLITIIVICVIAGGSYYSVPVLPAVVGLILCGALPIGVFMLMRESPAENIVGVIAFFLTATLIKLSINTNSWLITSINRGFANEHQARQLESALEKSSLANRVQSDFLANISHEIRAPMTGLLGMLQLLRTNNETGETARFLDIANNSARTLQVLMNDLLDMSKLQSGQFSIHPSPIDLITLLDESLALLRPLAVEKGLLLEVDTSRLQPHCFHMDDARMRQVFYNLTSNAIKFTERGSVVVSIHCKAITPEMYRLQCDIKDTGIGIAKNQTKTLFDRFTQVDTAQSRTRTGSGLGLTICRELLLLMDGTLSVESALGKGSTFSFSLPAKKASPNEVDQDQTEQDSMPASKQYHLLVADDNEINRLIIERMIKNLGWTVDAVDSGGQAIELFSANSSNYDAILMDIQMPVLDGIETTKRIRALNSQGMRLPIIAVTANAYHNEPELLRAQQMDGYIPKPINSGQLHKVVSNAILKGRSNI